jgi:hypothetical protein
MSPNSHSQHALDSIDQFIGVGGEIAKLPILALPQYKAAAVALHQIAEKLLEANENMARWRIDFLYFDFLAPNAREQFLNLVKAYRSTKAGPGFHDMKYRCGDIRDIYDRDIASKIADMFPADQATADEARSAFVSLGTADGSMVEFIYDMVIGDIDKFVHDAEQYVDQSDFNSAEIRRLEFKVASAELSERLERFGNQLSDLVLQYARLAK